MEVAQAVNRKTFQAKEEAAAPTFVGKLADAAIQPARNVTAEATTQLILDFIKKANRDTEWGNH